jgi:hypothetical protein
MTRMDNVSHALIRWGNFISEEHSMVRKVICGHGISIALLGTLLVARAASAQEVSLLKKRLFSPNMESMSISNIWRQLRPCRA